MHHAGRHVQILLSGDAKHILNDAVMIGASFPASRQNMFHIQKDDLGIFAGNDIAQEFFSGNGRVVFRKDLSFAHVPENNAISPLEIYDDIDASGCHKAEGIDRRSGSKDDVSLLEFAFMCPQAEEELFYFTFANAAEKLRVREKKSIHKILRFVVITTYVLLRLYYNTSRKAREEEKS